MLILYEYDKYNPPCPASMSLSASPPPPCHAHVGPHPPRTLARCQAAPRPELSDLIFRLCMAPTFGAVMKKRSTCAGDAGVQVLRAQSMRGGRVLAGRP